MTIREDQMEKRKQEILFASLNLLFKKDTPVRRLRHRWRCWYECRFAVSLFCIKRRAVILRWYVGMEGR
jgi:hypothetical protein